VGVGGGVAGTAATTDASAAAPSTATAQNVARQPSNWPTSAPSGLPATFAAVPPAKTSAIARVRSDGATRSAATTDAVARNAPCPSAPSTRPAMSSSYEPATAASRLLATNTAAATTRSRLRGTRVPATTNSGPPTTMAAA
jgi:hypothetical protein